MNDTALALTCFGVQFAVGCIVLFRVWRSIAPVRKMLLQCAALPRSPTHHELHAVTCPCCTHAPQVRRRQEQRVARLGEH